MEVGLHVGACEHEFDRIANALRPPFEAISRDLSKDYGGPMQHLWIEFELSPGFANFRPPWAFRFQKKVGGTSPDPISGLPREVYENVGHYSIRPDFQALRRVPEDDVVVHILGLIYDSTSRLAEKRKRIGELDVARFRSDFLASCRRHGHPIDSSTHAS